MVYGLREVTYPSVLRTLFIRRRFCSILARFLWRRELFGHVVEHLTWALYKYQVLPMSINSTIRQH